MPEPHAPSHIYQDHQLGRKGRGLCLVRNNLGTRNYSRSLLHLRARKGEAGGSREVIRPYRLRPVGALNRGVFYGDRPRCGGTEGQSNPSSAEEENVEAKRMAYKYPKAQKFLENLITTHSPGELQDMGLDFLDLKIIKIEAKYPMRGLDRLLITLEERRPTRFEYVEEIDLAQYVQAMLRGTA